MSSPLQTLSPLHHQDLNLEKTAKNTVETMKLDHDTKDQLHKLDSLRKLNREIEELKKALKEKDVEEALIINKIPVSLLELNKLLHKKDELKNRLKEVTKKIEKITEKELLTRSF